MKYQPTKLANIRSKGRDKECGRGTGNTSETRVPDFNLLTGDSHLSNWVGIDEQNKIGVDYESRPMVVLCACNLPDPSFVDYDTILRQVPSSSHLLFCGVFLTFNFSHSAKCVSTFGDVRARDDSAQFA